ncbi:DNA-directed RNA polymerase III subunit RPC3 [Kappamyces sp. JEL0829]|nr:DNA-directed RNA polymerase III subunit RPC3 [Kappamyces sp. JEL0829]
MSSTLADLARNILSEHFGPIVEAVAIRLITKGRQTLAGLIRHCADLNTSSRVIRECLAILIQHNLVTFAESLERGRKLVYYEVSLDMVFLRERYPRFIQVARDVAGNEARDIHSLLKEQSLTASVESTIGYIVALINHKFIIPVTADDQNTLSDKYINAENMEIEKAGVPLTATEMKKLKARMTSERNAVIADGPALGAKRKLVYETGESNAGRMSQSEQDAFINSSTCFKVNPMQFHLYLRNAHLVKFAEQKLNVAASRVVQVFLDLVYPTFKVVREECSEARSLLTLSTAIAKQQIQLPIEDSVHNQLAEYAEHLSTDHAPFLQKIDQKADGLYQIRIKHITEQLKLSMLETIVMEKCGAVACRIFRLLMDKKKLDDKNVSKLALVDEKVARNQLYSMLQLGLVFMQDVPKTIDHSASRTVFLWYVDPARSIDLLLQDIYKTVHRLKEREQFELSKRRFLLQKASRSDIVSGEASLSEGEKTKLAELDHVLMQFSVQLARIDETMMVFRDY